MVEIPETEMVVLSWALIVDVAARSSRLVVVKRAIFAGVWGDDPGDVWMWREAKKDVDGDEELRDGWQISTEILMSGWMRWI